jgi:acetyl-CoA/propionyl-CoA carboxylase biotin carboxyl carrier protein
MDSADGTATEEARGTFAVHTRWVEEEFLPRVTATAGASPEWAAWPGATGEPTTAPPTVAASGEDDRRTFVVEVGGKRIEVSVPGWLLTDPPCGDGGDALPPSPDRARAAVPALAGTPLRSGVPVTADLPSTVRRVEVVAGQSVAAGDTVIVLEAMKMEHAVPTPVAGTVRDILVAAGDQVELDAVLMLLDPALPDPHP